MGSFMDREDVILSFVREELLEDEDVEINKDTSLFEGRVLNSLKLVEVILFLEEAFEIKIDPSEVNIDNLDTISNILGLIERKTSS
jgi:acyl carrier protein